MCFISGMARIFTAASGLVKLMGGGSWADTNLPEVFQMTVVRTEALKERLRESSSFQARL